ncbi:MAG: YbaK/EbsC family protein [Alphaproteobacteria bacterium]|nr:YbaK/EbsC family protein [Alphaproteobacteria bacterium]
MAEGGLLERATVRRVRDALAASALGDRVVALPDTARSAQEAAAAIGAPLGAIVKSLVFTIGGQPVMALVAGDRRCAEKALKGVLGLEGKVRRADADAVRAATGFTIGGVSPVALATPLPLAIDASLWRFDTVHAAAGHPHCVFPLTPDELAALTGGTISDAVAPPAD